jgi:hypothetical protein
MDANYYISHLALAMRFALLLNPPQIFLFPP